VGIRKALRRCQQDGRCPSQRSSQRFPWLRIQCRQGGFVDGAGYQTPTQLGCGFLFLARFGERPRGGRSAFYQKYGEKCLNIQIMANTGNNCASTALCLTMSDKCEQSKAEHCARIHLEMCTTPGSPGCCLQTASGNVCVCLLLGVCSPSDFFF
jgi:hypothetical protein